MSIKFEISYDEEFSSLYNNFLGTEKGKKLLAIEGISPDKFDRRIQSYKYHTSNYNDETVDGNANAGSCKSPSNYSGEIGKAYDKLDGLYLLWKYGCRLYSDEIANDLISSIISGDLYFHDSTKVDIPYCFAATFSKLMTEGRPWASPVGTPPKSLRSFINQVSETVMDLSQEFAGAIAIADLMACMIYYVRKENTSDYDIRNYFQSLVHIVNNKFRTSGQSPFTNVSMFDRITFDQLFSDMIFPDGTNPTWEEFDRIQKIYGEWFSIGDPTTKLPYPFPVTTNNIFINDNGEPADNETFEWFCKINLEKAGFNFFCTKETGKLASCCRLVNDLNLMAGVNSSFGNGGLNIGSARVVTVNLPRIAYRVKQDNPNCNLQEFERDFIKKLDVQLEKCKKLLLIQRKILKERIDKNYLKFFTYGWCNLDLHLFSTVGYVGIYEAMEQMNKDPLSEDLLNSSINILSHLKDKTFEWSKEVGVPFNVEQIPAESAAYKLAQKDQVLYNIDYKLYSNQFVPLNRKSNIIERLKIDGLFSQVNTGGAIVHLNLGEKLQTIDQMIAICKAAIKAGCSQFAPNYDFCICEQGHVTCGNPKQKYCPICGHKIKDYMTRIIGYFTKISTWARPRREDHPNRDYNQIVKI